jgi:transposase
LPKDFPPYSTVYWHYKQWRDEEVINKVMNILHQKFREKAKKNRNGQL